MDLGQLRAREAGSGSENRAALLSNASNAVAPYCGAPRILINPCLGGGTHDEDEGGKRYEGKLVTSCGDICLGGDARAVGMLHVLAVAGV